MSNLERKGSISAEARAGNGGRRLEGKRRKERASTLLATAPLSSSLSISILVSSKRKGEDEREKNPARDSAVPSGLLNPDPILTSIHLHNPSLARDGDRDRGRRTCIPENILHRPESKYENVLPFYAPSSTRAFLLVFFGNSPKFGVYD